MDHSEDINEDEEHSIEEDEFSPIDFIPSEDVQSGMHKPSGENMWKSNASFNRIGIGLLDVPMASGESVYDDPDAGGSEPLGIGYVSRPVGLRDSDYEENFDDVNNENSLPAGNVADKKGAKMKRKIALDSREIKYYTAPGDKEFLNELSKIGLFPKEGIIRYISKIHILRQYLGLTRDAVDYYRNKKEKEGLEYVLKINDWLASSQLSNRNPRLDMRPVVRSLKALRELYSEKRTTDSKSDLQQTPIDKQIESDSLYGRESYIDSSIESDSFYDIDDDVVNIENKGRGNTGLTSQKAIISKKRFESQTKVPAGKYLSTIREFQKRLKVLINNDLGVDGDWGPKSSKAWAGLLEKDEALSEAVSLGDSKSIYRIVMNEKGRKNIGTIDSSPKVSPKEKDVPTEDDVPPKAESAPPIEGEKPGQVPDSAGKDIDVSEFVVATLLPEDNPKKRGVALLNFRGNRPEGVKGSGDFETLIKEPSGWKISSVTPVERRMLMMKSKGKLEKSERKTVRRKMRRDNRTTRRLNRMKRRKASLNDRGLNGFNRIAAPYDVRRRSPEDEYKELYRLLTSYDIEVEKPSDLKDEDFRITSLKKMYDYFKLTKTELEASGKTFAPEVEYDLSELYYGRYRGLDSINNNIYHLGLLLNYGGKADSEKSRKDDSESVETIDGGMQKNPKRKLRPPNAFELRSFQAETGVTLDGDLSVIKEFQRKIREKDTPWLRVDGYWGDKSAMAWAIFLEKPGNEKLKEVVKSKDGDRVKSLFLYDREYISKDDPKDREVSVNTSDPVKKLDDAKPTFAPPISSEMPERGRNKSILSDDTKPTFAPPASSEIPGRGGDKPVLSDDAKPTFAPPISPEVPAPITVKPTNPESEDTFVEVRDFVVSTMSKSENPKGRDVALLRFKGDRPEGLAGSGEYDTAARSGGVWSISSVSPVERRMLILKSKNILSRKDLRGVRKKLRRDNRTTRRLNRMNNRRKASIEMLKASNLRTALEARLSRLIK